MLREMCKSKIHRATVTETNLSYEGSITIDRRLMDEADLLPFEKVQVVNCNNGNRAETYVIEGAPDSGEICVNGALARHAEPGDKVIIIGYGLIELGPGADFKPQVVLVDEGNRLISP